MKKWNNMEEKRMKVHQNTNEKGMIVNKIKQWKDN